MYKPIRIVTEHYVLESRKRMTLDGRIVWNVRVCYKGEEDKIPWEKWFTAGIITKNKKDAVFAMNYASTRVYK